MVRLNHRFRYASSGWRAALYLGNHHVTAIKIAANTPIELDAVRTLETQAQARYNAKLATVIEVADAQRLLRQAEVDNFLARLGVWRALFAQAAAQGNMDEVLTAASR